MKLDWNYEKQLKSELKAAEAGVAVMDAGVTRSLGAGLYGVDYAGKFVYKQVPVVQDAPRWEEFTTIEDVRMRGDTALVAEVDFWLEQRAYAVNQARAALERVTH